MNSNSTAFAWCRFLCAPFSKISTHHLSAATPFNSRNSWPTVVRFASKQQLNLGRQFAYSTDNSNPSRICNPKYATITVISIIPIVGITRRSGANIGSVNTNAQRHHFEYGVPPTHDEITRANNAIRRMPNVQRTSNPTMPPVPIDVALTIDKI